MNMKDLPIEERMLAAALLESLRVARQIAYQAVPAIPDVRDYFERLEVLYSAFAEDLGTSPRPVFDKDEYIRKRIAAGDALYAETAIGRK